VGRRPNRRLCEFALDTRPRGPKSRALEEEPLVELGGQTDDDVDRQLRTELLRHLPRDLFARGSPGKPGDDRREQGRDDRVGGRHPLRVPEDEDSAVLSVRDNDGFEST
jgi:hypothetical protein